MRACVYAAILRIYNPNEFATDRGIDGRIHPLRLPPTDPAGCEPLLPLTSDLPRPAVFRNDLACAGNGDRDVCTHVRDTYVHFTKQTNVSQHIRDPGGCIVESGMRVTRTRKRLCGHRSTSTWINTLPSELPPLVWHHRRGKAHSGRHRRCCWMKGRWNRKKVERCQRCINAYTYIYTRVLQIRKRRHGRAHLRMPSYTS